MISVVKSYQFTLTDKYVSSWGYLEGIRELLQNAYDYGNYDISFGSDSIIIKNYNDKIQIKTLLMGYGTKSNDKNSIGGFGEGFVLALLVLLRQGFQVHIENADEVWIPYFQESEEFNNERLFHINVLNSESPTDDLSIIVSGFSPEQLNSIQDEFLGLQGDYSSIKTLYGEILTDPNQKGKMYVEGLPITTDRDFEYGYNFKAEYVILDRDRKDINHKELKKITSMAIVHMEEDNFDFVDSIVDSGKEDIYAFNHKEIEFPKTFVDKYSDHLKKKFGVADTSVVVNKTDEKVIKELEDMGEEVVTVDRKIYADIINETSEYSNDKYQQASKTVSSRSKVDDAWIYFRNSTYSDLLDWLKKYESLLSEEAIEEYKSIMEYNEPYLFELIRDEVLGDTDGAK